MGIMLVLTGAGIWLWLTSANYLAGCALTAFGAFASFRELRQATNTTPPDYIKQQRCRNRFNPVL